MQKSDTFSNRFELNNTVGRAYKREALTHEAYQAESQILLNLIVGFVDADIWS